MPLEMDYCMLVPTLVFVGTTNSGRLRLLSSTAPWIGRDELLDSECALATH
jgi:hypothetical protein